MNSPHHERLLGGARSGKSRTAEQRAAWLAAHPANHATLVATALPGDKETAERMARHHADRAERVPTLATVEAPRQLAATLRGLDDARQLLVVDCLTLWLTQWLLLPPGLAVLPKAGRHQRDDLLSALHISRSPVVLVSKEIGLGVMPMAREARAYVDVPGRLHQDLTTACSRMTLMVAGCELSMKDLR